MLYILSSQKSYLREKFKGAFNYIDVIVEELKTILRKPADFSSILHLMPMDHIWTNLLECYLVHILEKSEAY